MARSTKIQHLTTEQHQEAVRLWSIGLRSWAIGKRLGVAHQRILYWIMTRQNDFPLKKKVNYFKANMVRGLPSKPVVHHAPCLDEVIAAANLPGLALHLNCNEECVHEVLRLLVSGATLGAAARSAGTDYGKMRAVRHHIGWCKKWRRSGMRYSQNCGSLSKDEICQLRKDGLTLKSIGLRCGVTRERIRQVCNSSGLVPAHVITKANAKQRIIDDQWQKGIDHQQRMDKLAAQAAATKARVHRHMDTARQMWICGISIMDIAAHYKVSINSMSWRIHNERQNFGVDTFPYRDPRRTGGHPSVSGL